MPDKRAFYTTPDKTPMTTQTPIFNLSTTSRKAGKLGLGKASGVIETASSLTSAEMRDAFNSQVNALIINAEADLALASRRYCRTNRRNFANAMVRAQEKIATLQRAIQIANSLTF